MSDVLTGPFEEPWKEIERERQNRPELALLQSFTHIFLDYLYAKERKNIKRLQ